jgi:hypothetical protein
MLMSPDSSSAEIDSHSTTSMSCGPIQMIQVPECTQSHGIQLPKHVIHVDYAKKSDNDFMSPTKPINASVFHHKPQHSVNGIVQQKSDEELNLGEHSHTRESSFQGGQ